MQITGLPNDSAFCALLMPQCEITSFTASCCSICKKHHIAIKQLADISTDAMHASAAYREDLPMRQPPQRPYTHVRRQCVWKNVPLLVWPQPQRPKMPRLCDTVRVVDCHRRRKRLQDGAHLPGHHHRHLPRERAINRRLLPELPPGYELRLSKGLVDYHRMDNAASVLMGRRVVAGAGSLGTR